MKTPKSNFHLILVVLCLTSFSVFAQQTEEPKSTNDLSFLIGKWDIVRVNSPGSENERKTIGTLACEEALDDQFIKCRYEMQRPGKIRGLDVVYFNYNSIYGLYESMWLSSTWPIKGILRGDLEKNPEELILKSSSQFKIENDVTEYVKDTMNVKQSNDMTFNSFERRTHIRTSNYEEGIWLHHMTETAIRVE